MNDYTDETEWPRAKLLDEWRDLHISAADCWHEADMPLVKEYRERARAIRAELDRRAEVAENAALSTVADLTTEVVALRTAAEALLDTLQKCNRMDCLVVATHEDVQHMGPGRPWYRCAEHVLPAPDGRLLPYGAAILALRKVLP